MSARRALRPSPRWFRSTPEYVCGEGTKYVLVLAAPRAPGPVLWLVEVLRSSAVVAALLPLGFLTAILVCAAAWLGVDAVTTHLVVSAR